MKLLTLKKCIIRFYKPSCNVIWMVALHVFNQCINPAVIFRFWGVSIKNIQCLLDSSVEGYFWIRTCGNSLKSSSKGVLSVSSVILEQTIWQNLCLSCVRALMGCVPTWIAYDLISYSMNNTGIYLCFECWLIHVKL